MSFRMPQTNGVTQPTNTFFSAFLQAFRPRCCRFLRELVRCVNRKPERNVPKRYFHSFEREGIWSEKGKSNLNSFARSDSADIHCRSWRSAQPFGSHRMDSYWILTRSWVVNWALFSYCKQFQDRFFYLSCVVICCLWAQKKIGLLLASCWEPEKLEQDCVVIAFFVKYEIVPDLKFILEMSSFKKKNALHFWSQCLQAIKLAWLLS